MLIPTNDRKTKMENAVENGLMQIARSLEEMKAEMKDILESMQRTWTQDNKVADTTDMQVYLFSA